MTDDKKYLDRDWSRHHSLLWETIEKPKMKCLAMGVGYVWGRY